MACPKKVLTLLSAIGLCLGNATSALGQRVHDQAKAEVLTLPLIPAGFAASEMNVPAGLYVLSVLNRSGVTHIRIEIDKMPSRNLTDTPVSHTGDGPEDTTISKFRQLVRLTPGTYRVRVTGHTNWTCAINVK